MIVGSLLITLGACDWGANRHNLTSVYGLLLSKARLWLLKISYNNLMTAIIYFVNSFRPTIFGATWIRIFRKWHESVNRTSTIRNNDFANH